MSLLKLDDLSDATIIEVGCGPTFPSLNFYVRSKPKHVLAVELQPLLREKLPTHVNYIEEKFIEINSFEKKYNSLDYLIMSKIFNRCSENQARGLLEKYVSIKPQKVLVEEYNVVGGHANPFLGVDKIALILESLGYEIKILRNTRIFPERYYEGSCNLKHRIYNIFFCKRDVLIATRWE